MSRTTPPPLALYIHLPWCVRKCPYCDFNSHAAPAQLPVEPYTRALIADLLLELAKAPGRLVETVFIGGGTPSLFPPPAIAQVLDALGDRLAADAEVTLEANPGTFEQGRFEGFRAAGVNRLSIGVQSFAAEKLHSLGRIHGRNEALQAAEAARNAGFESFNLDLMYALPDQTVTEALADLEQAIRLQPPHLSHYQLTLEPNTVFFSRPPTLPDQDTAADMQDHCQALLAEAGYEQYEVSAYARPGHRCRHNLNYWRFGDYLAVGAGAHGKITHADGTVQRYRKVKVPALYMQRMGKGGADTETRAVDGQERVLEFMMNALRLRDGFTESLFSSRTGLPMETAQPGLDRALAEGWMVRDGESLRLSDGGRNHLDTVLTQFLPG
ncbi:MAG: radical SAM family heme chaperone HemW [Aquisalimonadaceae bacterium]